LVLNDIPANIEADTVYVRGFETPLAQVIRNLIDNALTFSPPDGTITLTPRIERGAKGDIFVVTVDDEGPGIPPDNLETIFERFYTERPKGAQFGSHSGLGLAICRQIMGAHKGAIRAENREKDGKIIGARFIITLPRYRNSRKSA
jgi:two-component system sensor histidine kinase ChvG